MSTVLHQERVPWVQRGYGSGEHSPHDWNMWHSLLAARGDQSSPHRDVEVNN